MMKSQKANLSLMASGDWQERRKAIENLANDKESILADSLLEMVRENPSDLNALNSALQLLILLDAPVVPGLIQLLHNDDPEIQAYAAFILGQVKDQRQHGKIIIALLEALDASQIKENSVNLRFNIIEALGRLKAASAVDRILKILDEDNFFLSFGAVHALGEIGDTRVQSQLFTLLDDPMLDSAAVSALGKAGDVNAIEPVNTWFSRKNGDPALVSKALGEIIRRFLPAERLNENEDDIIMDIGKRLYTSLDQSSIDRLLSAVPEDNPPIPTAGDESHASDLALVLGLLAYTGNTDSYPGEGINIDSARLLQALIQLFKNPNAYRSASASLVLIGKQALPWLKNVLAPSQSIQEDDPDCIYRREAALAMGYIGDPEVIAYLENALIADDVEVMMAAAESLGKIGGDQAVNVLLSHLGHPSTAVRKTVVDALYRNDSILKDPLFNLLESPDPLVKESAIRLLPASKLVKTYHDTVVPLLLEAAGEANINIRRTAIETLPFFDDPQIPSAIAEALQEREPDLRAAAVRSLGSLEPGFALPLLYSALEDPDLWVRMHACRSIAKFGKEESLVYILSLVNDEMPPIRAAAAEALGGFDGEKVIDPLKKLLVDEEPVVQEAAELSLKRIKGEGISD
jgi:HEAT repeat protein